MLAFTSCREHVATAEEREQGLLAGNHEKHVTETKFSFFAGMMQPGHISLERLLDTLGRSIRETGFSESGAPEIIRRYYYDSAGKLLLVYAMKPSGEMLYKIARKYDDGRLAELYFHLPGGTFKYRQVYEYDRDGRIKRLSWYWPTGLRARNVYTYEGIHKTSDTEYDATGHVNYRWYYAGDTGDGPVESIQRDAGGKESRRIRSEYEDGRMRLQRFFVQGDFQECIVYHYNTMGLLQWKCTVNASDRPTVFYQYDYSGKL